MPSLGELGRRKSRTRHLTNFVRTLSGSASSGAVGRKDSVRSLTGRNNTYSSSKTLSTTSSKEAAEVQRPADIDEATWAEMNPSAQRMTSERWEVTEGA